MTIEVYIQEIMNRKGISTYRVSSDLDNCTIEKDLPSILATVNYCYKVLPLGMYIIALEKRDADLFWKTYDSYVNF